MAYGGFVIAENVEESYISDGVVKLWGLEVDNGQTSLSWRAKNSRKTYCTVCYVVPSQKIPDHDVQFGKGYKDPKVNKARDKDTKISLDKEPKSK